MIDYKWVVEDRCEVVDRKVDGDIQMMIGGG